MKLSKNLDSKEIECKCGCSLNKLDSKTVEIFQKVRDYCGFPIIINSGCRCSKHNKAVGGVADSAHLPDKKGICHALDLNYNNSQELYKMLKGLFNAGCTRIGINFQKHFVHFDTDNTKPQNVVFKY